MPRYRSSSAVTVVMLAIYDKHGTVTPQLVVEEATPSGSPITRYGHLEAFWKAMGGLTPPTPPI
jgi:hypothetical protein